MIIYIYTRAHTHILMCIYVHTQHARSANTQCKRTHRHTYKLTISHTQYK